MQCINFFSFLVDEGTTQSPPDVTSQSDDPPLSVSSQSESGKKLIFSMIDFKALVWYIRSLTD